MIIDGKAVARVIEERVKKAVDHIKGRKPALAFLLIGNNPASVSYIRMKKKRCKEVGIISIDMEFPDTLSEDALLVEIEKLNTNPEVDGILVQLPLPLHIRQEHVLEMIDPKKRRRWLPPNQYWKTPSRRKKRFLSLHSLRHCHSP